MWSNDDLRNSPDQFWFWAAYVATTPTVLTDTEFCMLGAMLENPENRETDSEITRGENPYEHARELYNYNKSMRELPAAGNSPPKSSRKKLTTVKAEKLFREGKAVDDVAQIIGISAVNARTIKSRMRPKS